MKMFDGPDQQQRSQQRQPARRRRLAHFPHRSLRARHGRETPAGTANIDRKLWDRMLALDEAGLRRRWEPGWTAGR
jgi:hypothetical protein